MSTKVSGPKSWWRRNRVRILALFLGVVFVVGSLELLLRVYISYNPGYYTAFSSNREKSEIQYPYGIIKINNFGFPDEDFALTKKKPRIAYIGDSVCFGVGVGYGYRISELLEERMPEFEHMNFAYVAQGINEGSIRDTVEFVETFDLDMVVYLMNLNDVLPQTKTARDDRLLVQRIGKHFDWLRGKSYLYTSVRTIVKEYYTRLGYQMDGLVAYELFPTKYRDIFEETAAMIRQLNRELENNGVQLLTVILPYEMQISEGAERKYSELGIQWEAETFINGGPQKQLLAHLEGVSALDAYYAFVDEDAVDHSRRENELGEYFVYNLGDKLDWNHPNRAGHSAIATFMYESGLLMINGSDLGTRPASLN